MDIADWFRAFAALAATLALMGLMWLGARRLKMLQGLGMTSQRRLAVVESLMLDPRRRLVIVRAGEEEHLLLLSPFGDSRLTTGPGLSVKPAPQPTPETSEGAAP